MTDSILHLRNRSQYYVLSLIALVLVSVVGRTIFIGSEGLSGDPAVWKALSSVVSSGGTPWLDFADNKPPLFILLVAIGSVTNYFAVMTFVVALSNAVVIQCIYDRLFRHNLPRAGVIAAAIATGTIILFFLNYKIINNKVISLAVLLLALRSENSTVLGTGIAVSALIAQQSVIAIPLILWYRFSGLTEITKFVLSGIITTSLGYGLIALIWGWSASLAAIEQSLLLAVSYTAGTADMGYQLPIWNGPIEWVRSIFFHQQALLVSFILSLAGLYYVLSTDAPKGRYFELWFLVLSGSLLLVRPWWHYGYYALIPLSLLGGYGIVNYTR